MYVNAKVVNNWYSTETVRHNVEFRGYEAFAKPTAAACTEAENRYKVCKRGNVHRQQSL